MRDLVYLIREVKIALGYNKKIYDLALSKMQARKRQALLEHSQRMRLFYMRFPRAKELDETLSKTAVQAAKVILNGANVKTELTKLKKKNRTLRNELEEICNQANIPIGYTEVKYNCEKCCDEGYINGVMCRCMRELLRNEAYDRLNSLSPLSLSKFEDFSLDCYPVEPIHGKGPSPQKRMNDIFKYCKKYAENFSLGSPSLIMQGATGLGKTHLSLAIANVVINKRFGVIYSSAPNIISRLEKERFGYRDRDFVDSENYLIDCDLLILDDLGTEYSTTYSNAAIYNVVNSRIMMSKPTIISTNLSMRELEKAYSERLVSRLMGHHVRLDFVGFDVRQKKQCVKENVNK